MHPTKGSAAAAPAAPESAGRSTFAVRSELALREAREATQAAALALQALPDDTPPLQLAAAADELVKAAGALWMYAHRVAETRTP